MQISCPNCKKTFNLEDKLIPDKGRLLQCGSCQNKWFFKKKQVVLSNVKKTDTQIDKKKDDQINETKTKSNIGTIKPKNEIKLSEKKEQNKIVKKKQTNFIKLFLIILISFVGIIILVDTFKLQIAKIFPGIELILHNLYETLKDVYLFIKDFIK